MMVTIGALQRLQVRIQRLRQRIALPISRNGAVQHSLEEITTNENTHKTVPLISGVD